VDFVNDQEAIRDAFRVYHDTAELSGVTDPEKKRKVIGKAFIDVFQAATKKAGKAKYYKETLIYRE
jgi:GMP synthase PP-ATPase subunit